MTSPRPARAAAPIAGILVVMLGLGLLGNELNSIGWRLKARLFYKEGSARVVRTQIYEREGVFELETTYRLLWDEREGRETASLDPDDPWVPTRDDALARQSKIIVGQNYPCWYSARAPEDENVLAPNGLQLGKSLARLWMPFCVLIPGCALFWWGRRAMKDNPAPREQA